MGNNGMECMGAYSAYGICQHAHGSVPFLLYYFLEHDL